MFTFQFWLHSRGNNGQCATGRQLVAQTYLKQQDLFLTTAVERMENNFANEAPCMTLTEFGVIK
jgi:hypothetical protein